MMTMDVELAQRVLYDYIIPLVCLLGMLGNGLMLATILYGSRLQGAPYLYLAALAFADLVVLITVLGISIVRCVSCQRIPNSTADNQYELFAYRPLANMAAMLIAFLTLAMTVERFIHVRHPLMAHRLCSARRTRRLIATLVIVATLSNIPRFYLKNLTEDRADSTVLTLRCQRMIITTHSNEDQSTPTWGCTLPEDIEIPQKDDIQPPSLLNYFFSPSINNLNDPLSDHTTFNETPRLWVKCFEDDSLFRIVHETPTNGLVVNVTARNIQRSCRCVTDQKCPIPDPFTADRYGTSGHNIYFLCICLLSVFSYVLVGILNVVIIFLVNKSTQYRVTCLMEHVTPHLRHLQMREQIHLTRSLLCITFLQCITNLVYVCSIPHLARLLYDDDLDRHPVFKVHAFVSNLLIVLQCSLNFMLFALFNRKFQREFRRLFTNKCCHFIKKMCSYAPKKFNYVKTVSSHVSSEESYAGK